MTQSIDLRTALDAAAEGLLLLSHELSVIDVNDVFLQHYGLQRDDVLGHSILELFPYQCGALPQQQTSAQTSADPSHVSEASLRLAL